MKKRICAFMLSFAYLLTSFSIPAGAEAPSGGNGGGQWDDAYAGLRFSLVTPDDTSTVGVFEGKTIQTVDIFNRDVDHLMDNSNFFYRCMTQCKIDIASDPYYDPNDHVNRGDYWNTPAQMSKTPGVDNPWYFAYEDEIFTHSDTIALFDPIVIDYVYKDENNQVIDRFYLKSSGVNYTDKAYCFLNEWMKKSLISDGNKTTYEFYGICDLLEALGLNIYTSASPTMRELYINIINEFVIPNYAIIVEPVYLIPFGVYDYRTLADGGLELYKRTYCIYYGSATEIAIIEETCHMLYEGDTYLSGYYNANGNSFSSNELYMGVITQSLAQKAAYITDEYKDMLTLYAGNSLATVNDCDWDYYSFSSYDNIPDSAKNGWTNWLPDNFNVEYKVTQKLSSICFFNDYDDVDTYYYYYDYIKSHACGMTMITSSDIVKPVIEAFDYEFPVDTEVVTSVEVSNKSLDESYLPSVDEVSMETVTNANGVPVSLVCEFVMSEIETTDENGITNSFVASVFDEATGQWKMTDEVKSRFYTEEGYDDSDPPDEDEAEPLPEISAAYYATIDGLVSKGVSMENGYADAFASINWTTPKHPCKVKFRVNFYNADYDIEPVLGTAAENSRNGQRETKISSDNGTGICYTDFECVINEKFRTTVSEIELPNPASITSVETASVISDPDERERYEQSVETRDNYFDESETGDIYFDRYLNEITGGSQPSTVHKWTEFVSYNNGTDIGLNVYQHKAEAVIENDENSLYDDGTSRVVRTDINGLYEPYSDKLASGYGFGIDFTTCFDQDPLGLDYNRSFTMHTVSGTGQINSISCSNNIVTNYQRGAALLPEYLYKDYYAEIEPVETTPVIGKELLSRYCLTKNKNSINYENEDKSEKSRIHFTPVWYPDGKYQVAVFMTDAYTPVGQLWYYRLYDIEIDGSIYDTWYVTRTNNY